MENELHPELAYQAGIEQDKKTYEVHPSLAVHMEATPEAQLTKEEVVDNPETTVEKTETVQEEPVREETSQPQQDSGKDRQWRALREKAERAERLEREMELRDRELAFYKNQTQAVQSKTEDDEYLTDAEKRMKEQLARYEQQVRENNEKLRKLEQQTAISQGTQRLYKEYPDIETVVSDDNVQRLKEEYPSLYNSVTASSDVYTVGAAAYEMIMAKGIFKKAKPILNQITDVSRNQSKPRSSSTLAADSVAPQPGQSPIHRASSFMGNSISSEEERKALYAEMVNASRHRV